MEGVSLGGLLSDTQERGRRAAEDSEGNELRGTQPVGDMHVHLSEPVQALGADAVDAAVGHDGARAQHLKRQAQLAAVRVSRQGQLVAVGGELLQDAGFRGMQERQGKVGILVRGAGDFRVVIQIMVWVVHTGGSQANIAHLEFHASLVGIVPAVLKEGRAHALPRQVHIRGLVLLPNQVVEGIRDARRPVIIGAKAEHPRAAQQRAKRAEDLGDAALVGKIVTGVDHQVRVEGVEA